MDAPHSSYPKDDTPGCAMEATEFSDLDNNFICFDILVVGVSRDECLETPNSAQIWDFHLAASLFELLVCNKYGVLHHKEVDGHKKMGIQRATFVLDKQGRLRLPCTVTTRTVMSMKY